jgi:YidC/Oxa1 family membrane protein insertase
LEDKRNIVIAMLLAGLILFGWPILANQLFPQPKVAAKPAASASAAGNAPVTGAASTDSVVPGTDTASVPAKSVPLNVALKSAARVIIETPKLKGSINLEGAKFDDMLLLTHRTALAKDSPPVRLFAPSGTKDAYFARFGWVSQGAAVPDDKSIWTASAAKLTPSTPVTLNWANPAGQTFAIELAIDKDYLITAKQSFNNAGTTPVQIAPFGLLSRSSKPADASTGGDIATFFSRIHVGPMGVFGGTANYDWNYAELDEAASKEQKFSTTAGWIGFTDKYWLAALIPDQKTPINTKIRAEAGVYQTQMVPAKMTVVAAGQSFAKTSRLFTGAKEVEVLDKYVDEQGIEMLDYAIDWGWFRVIEKAFFKILNFLFGYFGSFGLAIIGLTFIVRIFMFPIAQRQFASMAQMKVIQPKMKAVQDKYKDDKQRQQQEIMKLYKDEKVNPLAGCLPIFLQMPIFFALYKLLMLTVEMRHQPFLSPWINDLSAPDPWTPLNAFGLIPFQPPVFLAIGILPILLGISMWGIQRLNPQPMDDVQKQVFAIMPWMMMFLFAPLAAGLQVYYVVSNGLTILQQKWLYSRHPILKQQMAKEAEEKAAEKTGSKAGA